jgi:hypothetical protein
LVEGALTIAVKCAVTCNYPVGEVVFLTSVSSEVGWGITRGEI